VGYALRLASAERGRAVMGTYLTHPQPGLRKWDGSLEGFDALVEAVEPDVVIHAAGWTDVEACEADEERARAVNGTLPGAIAARLRGQAAYVFYSTEYVFDGTDGPYAEDDPTNPLSAYGRSKLLGEARVLDADPSALVIRTTVVYGPDPNEKNFVAQLRRRLGGGEPMRVPADQVSSPTFNLDLAAPPWRSWSAASTACGTRPGRQ
jgi:dTDP-4-dehydrorhamnose reductase